MTWRAIFGRAYLRAHDSGARRHDDAQLIDHGVDAVAALLLRRAVV